MSKKKILDRGMKRLTPVLGLVAALAFGQFVTGCHTVPPADTVYMVGYGCGATTGVVTDQAVKDPDVRKGIVEVAGKVRPVIPEVGQPIEAAWGPVAREHTEILVQEGKLTPAQGQLVISGFRFACVGWTALEDKYPNVRKYRDLTNSGISGFFDGFFLTFKEDCAECCEDCTLDGKTYLKLKSAIE